MATEGDVGERLKLAIRRRGLSTKQAMDKLRAAKVPGSSQGNFYRILRNDTSPTTNFIVGASRELGVSVGWLASGEGKMTPHEPFPGEDVNRYGVQDLPEVTQNDVLGVARRLLTAMDRSGLNLDQLRDRTIELSSGIAAWLRIPLSRSDKFRQLDPDLEAMAFCDMALRALGFLVPESGDPPTPSGTDKALTALAELERRLAGGKTPFPEDEEQAATEGPASSEERRGEPSEEEMAELLKVEVAKLSADQQGADELSVGHRRRTRQNDEVERQLQEILRLARERPDDRLPDLLRDVVRTLAEGREPPPGTVEPPPDEPGPAVLGEEYTGPPVPEPAEFTLEEKKALAGRAKPTAIKVWTATGPETSGEDP